MYWIKHKACNPFQIKRNHLVCDSSRSTEERVSFKLICTFIFSIFSSLHYGLSIHNASRTYIVPYITMWLSIVYYLIINSSSVTLHCVYLVFFISVQWFNKLYNSPFHNTVSIHYSLFYFMSIHCSLQNVNL